MALVISTAMPERTQKLSPTVAAKSWLVPALAAGLAVAAVISYGRTEERQAAPGSPYYDKAVKEALNGLKGADAVVAPEAGGHPPLPAGLSAADYYWCDTCKSYHKRDAAAGQPIAAVASQPVVASEENVIPPLPEGLSTADYYWCPDCKAYHPRQAQGGAPLPAIWAGVPYPMPPQVNPGH